MHIKLNQNVNAYRDNSQAYTGCVPAGSAPVRIPTRSFPFYNSNMHRT